MSTKENSPTTTDTPYLVVWQDGGSETWDATDATTALLKAIADAAWDELHEGRTITLTAYEVTDDYLDHAVAWAEVTVRGGRVDKVSVEAQ